MNAKSKLNAKKTGPLKVIGGPLDGALVPYLGDQVLIRYSREGRKCGNMFVDHIVLNLANGKHGRAYILTEAGYYRPA